jgi:hypothetical protein
MAPLVEEIKIIIGEQGVLIKHGFVLFFARLVRHVKTPPLIYAQNSGKWLIPVKGMTTRSGPLLS